LHDGWPMLHAVWMRDAPTLMRMAHMMRMMDGDGMGWVKIDKRFDGIFGWDGMDGMYCLHIWLMWADHVGWDGWDGDGIKKARIG